MGENSVHILGFLHSKVYSWQKIIALKFRKGRVLVNVILVELCKLFQFGNRGDVTEFLE